MRGAPNASIVAVYGLHWQTAAVIKERTIKETRYQLTRWARKQENVLLLSVCDQCHILFMVRKWLPSQYRGR